MKRSLLAALLLTTPVTAQEVVLNEDGERMAKIECLEVVYRTMAGDWVRVPSEEGMTILLRAEEFDLLPSSGSLEEATAPMMYYVTRTGNRYHAPFCQFIKRADQTIPFDDKELAEKIGMVACKVCLPAE